MTKKDGQDRQMVEQKAETDAEESMERETKILAEDWSPICNIQAFAEDNGDCVYFYLWRFPNTDHTDVKACWVCNLKAAPEELDIEAMDSGMAPMMPAKFINHPQSGTQLDEDALSIVWFEEGDAAALLENDKILAVIPGWSGEGFSGYARYAKGQGPFAWELESAEAVLGERTQRSAAYWSVMENGYWRKLQESLLGSLEQFFGSHEKYFAIDGGHFPAKALVTGVKAGVKYGITAGVCALVQPIIEQYYQEETKDYHRIELGFAWEEEALSEKEYMTILSCISGLTEFPWKEISWLGHGHTVPFRGVEGLAAMLFLNTNLLPQLEAPQFEPFMEERVNLLWAVPLTEEEYRMAQQMGVETLLTHCSGQLERIHIYEGTTKFKE